jgi:hypothetical protein
LVCDESTHSGFSKKAKTTFNGADGKREHSNGFCGQVVRVTISDEELTNLLMKTLSKGSIVATKWT